MNLFILLVFFFATISSALAERESLRIGITQFPSSFHPNIDSMLAKSYINAMTARSFTIYDKDWKLICMLCVTLPSIENGLARIRYLKDGKKGISLTYEIKSDAAWGDGTPVSTSDVIFTWKVGKHKKSGVPDVEFYRSLYKIDIHDKKKFTLHFDKISFDYNAINSFRLIPAHLDTPNFSEPEKYKFRSKFNTETINPGLYFGPYRISEVVPGSRIVLKENPGWYGKKPDFKSIIVRLIENTAALEANLLSGTIDMVAGELGFSLEQAIAFERRHGKKYKIIYKPGLIYEHIDLNLDNEILSNLSVRKALIHSIDREAINKQLFSGLQPTAHSSVNPLDSVYSDNITRYNYDPDLADRLFVKAGWILDSDGRRYNKEGTPLKLKLMSTSGNRTREMVEQVLKSHWKRVGVDIVIKNEPARVFFGQTVTERKFPAMAMFAWISSPESVPRSTLHSSHIPTANNNFSGQNYTGFRNKEMDFILEKLEIELDKSKRKKLWHDLQEIYSNELPALPLYFRSNAYILPKWLKGITPTGHQGVSTNWVEYWEGN